MYDSVTIPDERLELIFTCCHPALALDAQVALTLRTLGGLSTEEIALAFLVPFDTMSKRLTREAQDSRRAHPVRRTTRSPASRPVGGRPCGGVPDLQRGLGRRSDRLGRRGDPAWPSTGRAHARRGRGARAAGVDVAARRTPGCAAARRTRRSSRRSGPRIVERGPDRRRSTAAGDGADPRVCGAVRRAGSDRGTTPASAARLGADRGAVRDARPTDRLTCCPAEPGHRRSRASRPSKLGSPSSISWNCITTATSTPRELTSCGARAATARLDGRTSTRSNSRRPSPSGASWQDRLADFS